MTGRDAQGRTPLGSVARGRRGFTEIARIVHGVGTEKETVIGDAVCFEVVSIGLPDEKKG
jgi:hypothetical protein